MVSRILLVHSRPHSPRLSCRSCSQHFTHRLWNPLVDRTPRTSNQLQGLAIKWFTSPSVWLIGRCGLPQPLPCSGPHLSCRKATASRSSRASTLASSSPSSEHTRPHTIGPPAPSLCDALAISSRPDRSCSTRHSKLNTARRGWDKALSTSDCACVLERWPWGGVGRGSLIPYCTTQRINTRRPRTPR